MRRALSFERCLSWTALGASALAMGVVGCGGGTTTTGGGPDGGSDATNDAVANAAGNGSDGSSDGGSAGGGMDSPSGNDGSKGDSSSTEGGGSVDGGDGGVVCNATPTACTNPTTGGNDFCTSTDNACAACTDKTDDAKCATAYGAGYLCVSGACVMGNCHTSQDCAGDAGTSGQICGATQPNTCGACTGDLQCQNDSYWSTQFSPAGPMCAAGVCATASCTGLNVTCTANSADVCCLNGTSGDVCVPGNCCTAILTCGGSVSDHCVGTGAGGACTTCTAVSNNTYVVDPSLASDTGSTGNTGSCAFRSITHALQFLGSTPPAGTIIKVLDTATVGPAETFPIIVPANVTIEGAAGAVPTVKVPAKGIGFRLHADNSGLAYLTLDGQTQTAFTGIEIVGGSTTAGTAVSNVTVQNFLHAGITAGASPQATVSGKATLSGVTVTGSGTAANGAPGMLVFAGGSVTISGGATVSSFSHNTTHGIEVIDQGNVAIDGTACPTTPSTCQVNADDNTTAGLWISQTPGTGLPVNTVTGLHISGITAGNGLHVTGGSQLLLRGSYINGNAAGSGVIVTAFGGTGGSSALSGIDLGNKADGANPDGNNLLQGSAGGATNSRAGVCIAIPNGAQQTLHADGNIWGAATCYSGGTQGTLTKSANCTNAVDVGGIGDPGNLNAVTVLGCTLP